MNKQWFVMGVALALVGGAWAASEGAPAGEASGRDALPEQLFIKTGKQTFDSRFYFALVDGRIWFKPNEETTGIKAEWKLFGNDGLPDDEKNPKFVRPGRIVEIHADGDDLVAIDDKSRYYIKTTKSASWTSNDLWHDKWGFMAQVLVDDERSARRRALTIGRRHGDVLWHEDIDGNPHHYGTMGTTTIYWLSENGQDIHFTDNGLPGDFSHQVCTPFRGRFVAENISASASMILLIDKHGQMFTRLEDFDINGGSSMFFHYSYKREKRPNDRGDQYRTNLTSWGLPVAPWRRQPPVPISGQARLTRDITILQNGHGNAAREIRVAGLNAEGQTGFWFKQVFDDAWQFKAVPLQLEESRFLKPEDVAHPESMVLGSSQNVAYEGEIRLDQGRGRFKARMEDFNLDCSPARLDVEVAPGKSFGITFHTVEAWSFLKRNVPGRDGTPKISLGTMVIDSEAIESTDPDIRAAVERLGPYHYSTFKWVVRASQDYLEIKTNNAPWDSSTMHFVRPGADPNGTFPGGLADGHMDPATFEFMNADGYKEIVSRPELVIPDLEHLTPADAGRLRSVIALNEEARKNMHEIYRLQKSLVDGTSLGADVWSVFGQLLKVTGLIVIPNFDMMAARGGTLLHAYAESGRHLFFQSKKAYRKADEALERRIALYERRLKEL